MKHQLRFIVPSFFSLFCRIFLFTIWLLKKKNLEYGNLLLNFVSFFLCTFEYKLTDIELDNVSQWTYGDKLFKIKQKHHPWSAKKKPCENRWIDFEMKKFSLRWGIKSTKTNKVSESLKLSRYNKFWDVNSKLTTTELSLEGVPLTSKARYWMFFFLYVVLLGKLVCNKRLKGTLC